MIRHVFLDLMQQVSILIEKYSYITVSLDHEEQQQHMLKRRIFSKPNPLMVMQSHSSKVKMGLKLYINTYGKLE
jgi:hypothetical protein